jgi:zinc transport system permease protein
MGIIELLSYPFFQRAIIGGLIVALVSGLLGIFVVLRKSSFFGDSIAHSSLTGVAVGLLLHIDPLITAAIVGVLTAVSLPWLEKKTKLPIDNLLGFLLPFSLGLAVIVLSFLPGYQPELLSFLFGSILSVSWSGILLMVVLSAIVLVTLLSWWPKFVAVTFDEDYARIRGMNTLFISTVLNIMLALTVVAGIKLVGIVLVNALLIIPVLVARVFARSLTQMVFLAPVISVACVIIGLGISVTMNLPTGPAIAVFAGLLFIISFFFQKN